MEECRNTGQSVRTSSLNMVAYANHVYTLFSPPPVLVQQIHNDP